MGGRLLAATFGGRRAVTGWDGSEVDAEQIIDSFAETSADDSEWDYWVMAAAGSSGEAGDLQSEHGIVLAQSRPAE